MPQSSSTDFSGQFHSEGSQWIGNTFNTEGGDVHFSAPEQLRGNLYNNNQIGGQAQVHFGNVYNLNQGVTVNAKVAIHQDYEGHYAYNALSPVSAYTHRASLHRQIQAQLHDRITQADRKTQLLIVHGIGGAGKTQLVLNYVQEHRTDYAAVFWIEARSKESVERDYIQIYLLLYGEHQGASVRPEDAVPAVKRWFYQRQRRCLFVFDSADSIDDERDPFYINLRYFLPDDPSVHIIVTTRSADARKMSELSPVQVGEMEEGEAVILFRKHAEMDTTSPQEDTELLSIVQELGCLALAVILAGSYVSTTPRLKADITQYLPEYRVRRKQLLAQRPRQLIDQYGESVLTTWETTFRILENECPEACRFLTLLSLLHGDDIFFDFGALITSQLESTWTSIISPTRRIDQYDIERFFSMLQSYSFVTFRNSQKSYSVHKLIQAWANDRQNKEAQETYSLAVISLLNEAMSLLQTMDPMQRDRLVPHLTLNFLRLQGYSNFPGPDNVVPISLLLMVAFLDSNGRRRDSRNIEEFLVAKLKLLLGKEDPKTISAMNDLAITLRDMGDLQEALSMEREVLAMRKKVLGEEHPDTILAMNNLASTLGKVGELQEALWMQREVLAKQKQILGDEHPHTIGAMSNLANTLHDLGELQDALLIRREVLAMRERILGKEHPDTIMAMNNLVIILGDVGELQEALSIGREVLAMQERILGKDHPDTIMAMSNLAIILEGVGELQEALSMKREVLAMRKEILGEEHPDTITAMNNLAVSLTELGELQEALSTMREVLAMWSRILGKEHPLTILAMNNLAVMLGDLGELEEALSMKREVLAMRGRILGDEHPDTIMAMNNLTSTLRDVGEVQEAWSMQTEVVKKLEKKLGEQHPRTAMAKESLRLTSQRLEMQQLPASASQEKVGKPS